METNEHNCSFVESMVLGVVSVCNNSVNQTHATSGSCSTLNLVQNALGILALFLVMTTSGCAVNVKEFWELLKKPWAILVGCHASI